MNDKAETTQNLEIVFRVNVDEFGMVDGRALAKDLLIDAFKLMATYKTPSMDGAVRLFQEMGAEVVDQMHSEENDEGMVPAIHFCVKEYANAVEGNSAFVQHVNGIRRQMQIEKNGAYCEQAEVKPI